MSEPVRQGIIIRSLSGFYDVADGDTVVRCRARGRFRKDGITPLVGDRVQFQVHGGQGTVQALLPRTSQFVRPAVANMDALVMMAAQVNPVTEPFLIDRVAAIAAQQRVELILVLNKCDLDPADTLYAIYQNSGMALFRISAATGQGVDALRDCLRGRLTAFTGNSGVGKSTLLNTLFPQAHIPTGEVSEKLGRGRHTTRHVELYRLPDGTGIVDTPGFSAFDTDQMDLGAPEQLALAFPEFAPYLGQCRFDDCRHVKEAGCAVLEALEAGRIPPSRHESYVRLYETIKEQKPWEKKRG